MQGHAAGGQPAAGSALPPAAELGRQGAGALATAATLAPGYRQGQSGGAALLDAMQGASDSEPEVATPQPAAAPPIARAAGGQGLPSPADASSKPDYVVRIRFGSPTAQRADERPADPPPEEARQPAKTHPYSHPHPQPKQVLSPAAVPATPQRGAGAARTGGTPTGQPGGGPGSPVASRTRRRRQPTSAPARGAAAALCAPDSALSRSGSGSAQDPPGSAQQPQRAPKRPGPDAKEPAPDRRHALGEAAAPQGHPEHPPPLSCVRGGAAQDGGDATPGLPWWAHDPPAKRLRQAAPGGGADGQPCALGSGAADACPAAATPGTRGRQGGAALGEPDQAGPSRRSEEHLLEAAHQVDPKPDDVQHCRLLQVKPDQSLAPADEADRARAAQAAADRKRKGKQKAVARQPSSSDDDDDELLSLDLSGGGIFSKFCPEGKKQGPGLVAGGSVAPRKVR